MRGSIIGPLHDPEILRNCLFELARLAIMAACVTATFISEPGKSLTAKAAFVDTARAWAATYMPGWDWRNE